MDGLKGHNTSAQSEVTPRVLKTLSRRSPERQRREGFCCRGNRRICFTTCIRDARSNKKSFTALPVKAFCLSLHVSQGGVIDQRITQSFAPIPWFPGGIILNGDNLGSTANSRGNCADMRLDFKSFGQDDLRDQNQMFKLPISFPSEVERLRRSIEADRSLSYLQRIQALDGIWNAVDLFASTAEELPARDRLRQLREEEGHKCIREFIQRQLAKQSIDAGASE